MAFPTLDQSTFDRIRRLVYANSGISLSDHKLALVATRLRKRLRALGIRDYRAYLRFVNADTTGQELVRMLDAISTNVTSFFREPAHFDFIKQSVERWLQEGRRRLSFWSAACATGEEPYSLAITLHDLCALRDVQLRILATDISTAALRACRAGVYAESKLRTVPPHILRRFFAKQRGTGDDCRQVREPVRGSVQFRRLNLAASPLPSVGIFDVILCRNVMIYFSPSVRERLVAELVRRLRPGGYLVVGNAESLHGYTTNLCSVRPSVYGRGQSC